jgi:predicted transcriptional regulator
MSLKSIQQLIATMAEHYDAYRVNQSLRDEDVIARGGVAKSALYKFKRGENISLSNFIKILRGLGAEDKLESLLALPEQLVVVNKKPPAKRVYAKQKIEKKVIWKDDEE